MIGVDSTFLVQLAIKELPQHIPARELIQREVIAKRETLALAPQVLAEYLHVVTDPRRFQHPLSMGQAVLQARFWWNVKEVSHVFPTSESTSLCLEWMETHKLGRKRILDTQLAATLWSAGVRRILTSNPADFKLLASFEILCPWH